MVIISLPEIKRFIAASKHVKDTRVLPIYAYVKLVFNEKGATFYKSNSHNFVICPVESETEESGTYIIEEATLSGFVNYARTEIITFKRVNGNIEISDGGKVVACQEVPDHYPAIPSKEDVKSITISVDALAALYSAKNHALPSQEKSMRQWNCFVHISKVGKHNYISGFNGFTSFIEKFSQPLPNIPLDPEVIAVISKMEDVDYLPYEKYDVFENKGVTYGFVKSETNVAPLETVLDNFGKKKDLFVVGRKRIVDFCEMVQNINTSAVVASVSMKTNPEDIGSLQLSYQGMTGQSANEEIPVVSKGEEMEEMFFTPKNVLLALKDLQFDSITFSKLAENLILSSNDEPAYLGSIMSIKPF